MEEIKKTNMMMVHPNQQVRFVPQQDLYAMEVDKTNRNYYDCGGFWTFSQELQKQEYERQNWEEQKNGIIDKEE